MWDADNKNFSGVKQQQCWMLKCLRNETNKKNPIK